MEIKSGKMELSLSFYYIFIYKYFFKVSSNKCFTSEIGYIFGQILFNPPPPPPPTFAAHLQKKTLFLPLLSFKVSVSYLFDNLESGKRNYCFAKKSGISMKSDVFHAFAVVDDKAPSFT